MSVQEVPVPWFRLDNIASHTDLGSHQYDNGAAPVGGDDRRGLFRSEKNGLVYTCRGGFIDTAHVRDYADWTLFFASRIGRSLESGTVIPLPEEGGERFVVMQPVDPALLARHGRRALAVRLAAWAAFNVSLWHEIATAYGWSASSVFPELSSAFSPEDLYSNLLGTELAGEIIRARAANTEGAYNEAVTRQLREALAALGAVSQKETRAALAAVDGLWWDSRQRLPAERLVVRRNLDVGERLTPWLVPSARLPRRLQRACTRRPGAVRMLRLPSTVEGRPFDDLLQLYVRVSDDLAERFPVLHPLSRWLTQRDFPAVLATLRTEMQRDLGPGADEP